MLLDHREHGSRGGSTLRGAPEDEVLSHLLEHYREDPVQRASKCERCERAGRACGYHDAHPDRRDHYGDQDGRPRGPSQRIVNAGDAQERPDEAQNGEENDQVPPHVLICRFVRFIVSRSLPLAPLISVSLRSARCYLFATAPSPISSPMGRDMVQDSVSVEFQESYKDRYGSRGVEREP